MHLAFDLDVGRIGAVDHNIGDIIADKQGLKRTIAQNVVADAFKQLFLLGDRHHHFLDDDNLADDVVDLLTRLGVLRFPNMALYTRAIISLSRSRRGSSSDARSDFCSDRSVRRSARERKASAGFDLSETSSII